jgi:hypothetical protein
MSRDPVSGLEDTLWSQVKAHREQLLAIADEIDGMRKYTSGLNGHIDDDNASVAIEKFNEFVTHLKGYDGVWGSLENSLCELSTNCFSEKSSQETEGFHILNEMQNCLAMVRSQRDELVVRLAAETRRIARNSTSRKTPSDGTKSSSITSTPSGHSGQVKGSAPPTGALFLLDLFLTEADRAAIPGDIEEKFWTEWLPKDGLARARLQFWGETVKTLIRRNPFCRWLLVDFLFHIAKLLIGQIGG